VCITHKASMTINPNCLSKLKDFLRSQAVMYTVKVTVSQIWCKIDTFYYLSRAGARMKQDFV